MATQETAREVAERLLAQEQEAERQGRLDELVRAEEERREEERREIEAKTRRAAAKERADALARERVEVVQHIEETAPALRGLVESYIALDSRHRAALQEAGETSRLESADPPRVVVGGFLASVLGDYVDPRGDSWRDAGAPPLRHRDRLCPKDGGEG